MLYDFRQDGWNEAQPITRHVHTSRSNPENRAKTLPLCAASGRVIGIPGLMGYTHRCMALNREQFIVI